MKYNIFSPDMLISIFLGSMLIASFSGSMLFPVRYLYHLRGKKNARYFFNLKEQNFYTVMFAVSRTLGVPWYRPEIRVPNFLFAKKGRPGRWVER